MSRLLPCILFYFSLIFALSSSEISPCDCVEELKKPSSTKGLTQTEEEDWNRSGLGSWDREKRKDFLRAFDSYTARFPYSFKEEKQQCPVIKSLVLHYTLLPQSMDFNDFLNPFFQIESFFGEKNDEKNIKQDVLFYIETFVNPDLSFNFSAFKAFTDALIGHQCELFTTNPEENKILIHALITKKLIAPDDITMIAQVIDKDMPLQERLEEIKTYELAYHLLYTSTSQRWGRFNSLR